MQDERDIRFLPAAISDLEKIEDHIASTAGASAAESVTESILNRCAALSAMPNSGSKRDEIRPGLRSVTQRRYVIYYTHNARTIFIMRIRHSARDEKKFFAPP